MQCSWVKEGERGSKGVKRGARERTAQQRKAGEDHVSVMFLPTYRSAISIVRLIRGPSLLQDS